MSVPYLLRVGEIMIFGPAPSSRAFYSDDLPFYTALLQDTARWMTYLACSHIQNNAAVVFAKKKSFNMQNVHTTFIFYVKKKTVLHYGSQARFTSL